jgi:very-short-patch-repair endonuclease
MIQKDKVKDGIARQYAIELGHDCYFEYRFDEVRRWRFDFCLPAIMVAIEVDGGAFSKRNYKDKDGQQITTVGGRHNSATGFLNDMEKLNAATSKGWRVFRTTPSKHFDVVPLIKKLLMKDLDMNGIRD